MTVSIETLNIAEIGARGDGIAMHNDQRVFIARTLPGETIHATLNDNRGILEDIITPSPQRVTPPCPHFGACGGCQLQHWEAAPYRDWKRQLLVTALQRAELETEIAPLVDAAGDGRRRVTMHGRKNASGFNALRSHDVHDIDICPVLTPALAPAADITRACYKALGDCDVAITATHSGLDVAIRAKRREAYAALTKVSHNFRLARLALNGEEIIMHRPPEIKMGKAMVRMPIGSFVQVTQMAEQVLAEHVLTATKGTKRVADLFCGVGPFALRIAEQAKIFALDNDKAAIAACDAALRATPGLKVIGTEVRDLFRDPLLPADLKPFDAVVFDPPRAGAAAQAHELAQSKVPLVVAISCDPVTFARDAAILVAGGYKLESATPIDQFIWSAHLETVGVFHR